MIVFKRRKAKLSSEELRQNKLQDFRIRLAILDKAHAEAINYERRQDIMQEKDEVLARALKLFSREELKTC